MRNILQKKSLFLMIFFICTHCANEVSSIREVKRVQDNTLSREEKLVDSWLSLQTQIEIKRFEQENLFTSPFAEQKPYIDHSLLFDFIKQMPKGAILHIHTPAIGSITKLVKDTTYQPDCYLYTGNEQTEIPGTLRFFPTPPDKNWKHVQTLRSTAKDIKRFDQKLIDSMTLFTHEKKSTQETWKQFENAFHRATGVITYLPGYKSFLTNAFQQFSDENIQHIELRGISGALYDLENGVYSREDEVKFIQEILKTHQKKNPALTVKIIDTYSRNLSKKTLMKFLEQSKALQQKFPKMVIGFDLVGEEDNSATLEELSHILQQALQGEKPIRFFLHAGESLSSTNKNIYTAIALKSKRIGHALTLKNYPDLLQKAINNSIAIETCPISNQELGYIEDLRNHPAVLYLEKNIPITISPDDPAIFGYQFVSYDWYLALLAWDLNLVTLKKIAENSLRYSALHPEEKQNAQKEFQKRWNDFILQTIVTQKLSKTQ